MSDPAVTAPIEARSNDWWRRAVRGAVQFAAGGGLTELFNHIVLDIPDRYDFYVLFASTALVTLSQNYCEDRGWIPAVLKAKPSGGDKPAP